MKTLTWLKSHIGNNQDFYLWPTILLLLYIGAHEAIFSATGRKPLADMAVNLEAVDGYVTETVPIFLSLFWASLAARFLVWNFKTAEDWAAAPWPAKLIDALVPLAVFALCMHHFASHS
jgi:hypothetical protein